MHLSVRPRRREDFAMNRSLLIAVYGAILAIALTFNFYYVWKRKQHDSQEQFYG